MTTDSPAADENAGHRLRKVLGLRDLIPMQILVVLGPSWIGTAAHQAGTQVSFWLLGAVLLFLPVAAVVQYCVQIWPYEGGVYQWTKHAFGPFAGFLFFNLRGRGRIRQANLKIAPVIIDIGRKIQCVR